MVQGISGKVRGYKKMQLDVDIEPTFRIWTYEIHRHTNGKTNAKISKAYIGELSAVILRF